MSRLLLQTQIPALNINLPELPVINWSLLGRMAPQPVNFHYLGPSAPLPVADVVVITWTTAEWSAMDHVFLNSQTTRKSDEEAWKTQWHLFSLDSNTASGTDLWGFYRVVSITNAAGKNVNVLLFKSSCHLAHPPYITGLTDMVQTIIKYVKPQQIYSIGTAGGATLNEMLGDVAVTNGAYIELQKTENLGAGINNQSISCTSWFPPTGLMDQVQNKLFYPLSNVLNDDAFNKMLNQLYTKVQGSSAFTLTDLINAPINPPNLTKPAALNKQNVPLLTTDYYFIGTGTDTTQYSVLEMDDGVVGYEAGKLNTPYVFVRNVSDPLVAAVSASGTAIPQPVRSEWSDLIYELCGFYSSFNSALTAWAGIAG